MNTLIDIALTSSKMHCCHCIAISPGNEMTYLQNLSQTRTHLHTQKALNEKLLGCFSTFIILMLESDLNHSSPCSVFAVHRTERLHQRLQAWRQEHGSGEHLAVVTAVVEGQSVYVCVEERYIATLISSLTTSEKPSELLSHVINITNPSVMRREATQVSHKASSLELLACVSLFWSAKVKCVTLPVSDSNA